MVRNPGDAVPLGTPCGQIKVWFSKYPAMAHDRMVPVGNGPCTPPSSSLYIQLGAARNWSPASVCTGGAAGMLSRCDGVNGGFPPPSGLTEDGDRSLEDTAAAPLAVSVSTGTSHDDLFNRLLTKYVRPDAGSSLACHPGGNFTLPSCSFLMASTARTA